MDGLLEIVLSTIVMAAGAGGLTNLLNAFRTQRKEAAEIRSLRLLKDRRTHTAEQLLVARQLWEDASRDHAELAPSVDQPSVLLDTAELEAELAALSAGIETTEARQEKESKDPQIAKGRKRARRNVILALFVPIVIDIAILIVAMPVALRWVGEWTLPSAIGVIFPATSGSGWAALIVSFFVPHMLATAVLGWWAVKVRHLDSEKFAKATETARSVAGGYVALGALLVCVYLIGIGNVGWYGLFSDSLRELTKPMLPLLSVAAFVATFGPGYSKYMEGLAELEKVSVSGEENAVTS